MRSLGKGLQFPLSPFLKGGPSNGDPEENDTDYQMPPILTGEHSWWKTWISTVDLRNSEGLFHPRVGIRHACKPAFSPQGTWDKMLRFKP